MTDPRPILDNIIDAMSRISLLATLSDMVAEARSADRRHCGNCEHWMKSSVCPREHNVNGYTHGPSMNEPACGQFSLNPWVWQLKLERLQGAMDFARRHRLPVPDEEFRLLAAASSDCPVHSSTAKLNGEGGET